MVNWHVISVQKRKIGEYNLIVEYNHQSDYRSFLFVSISRAELALIPMCPPKSQAILRRVGIASSSLLHWHATHTNQSKVLAWDNTEASRRYKGRCSVASSQAEAACRQV